MKVWVGGATGFLGAHVVRVLEDEGHKVVACSRSGGGTSSGRRAVDVLDESAVKASAKGCTFGLLCTGRVARGAQAAEELHRLHVEGTKRALAGLREAGVRRVVVASTSGTIAVSRDPEQIADETADAPLDLISRWPYYRSKYFGEQVALEANGTGFEVVIVNPSLLLGPGDLRESSTSDVRRFLEGQILASPAGGIAFVDARDAALGMVLAMKHGNAGQRYLLNGVNMTLQSFFGRLARLTGQRAPVLRMPRRTSVALGVFGLYDRALSALGGKSPLSREDVELGQHYWYCSSARAERELGFAPRDPGLTLRDTVLDLIERRVVPAPPKAL